MEDETGLMAKIEGILDKLCTACILLASLALVVLVVTFGWLVFGRYVLNSTPTWVEQLALLLVLYITYLGAAAGVHENTHLGVTLFRDATGPKVTAYIHVITDIILSAFGLIMCIASIELFQIGWDILLPMLEIPESYRTLSALLCGGLVFIFAGLRAIFRIVYLVQGKTYVNKGGL